METETGISRGGLRAEAGYGWLQARQTATTSRCSGAPRTGSVSREKLRRDLAGLPIVYAGEALLPHPGMARWVEARVREALHSASAARP